MIPTLGWDEALLRLALAAAFGGLIGIEREFREREAGLRTHMLVSVGSALFTLTSAYGFHDFLSSGDAVVRADPSRVAAQIVTGIGFLGAGAIIRQGLAVRGLTTAATLWVCAAIGLAAGTGYYSAALMTTGVTLFLLWPMRIVARRLFDRPHTHKLEVKVRRRRQRRLGRRCARTSRRARRLVRPRRESKGISNAPSPARPSARGMARRDHPSPLRSSGRALGSLA